MKSTFSRLFTLFAALILVCLLVLGIAFRVMLYDYLKEEKQQTLRSNAEAMARLAAVYDATGELSERWGSFRIALTSAARVAGTDAMICGLDGEIWMCACDDGMGCGHVGAVVERSLIDRVVAIGEDFSESTLSGCYSEPYFVEAMAVQSLITGRTVGVLLTAAPPQQIKNVLAESISIFMYVAVAVLALAVAAAFWMSRKQARSLEAVTGAAARFGRGELDARVQLGSGATREMTELAESFNSMAASLSQSERQRQEFVANVSHELRTPMTTISGFMDGMLDGTIPQERQRHYMQLVSDEVRRLSRLVRGMLDVSRLQTQSIESKKRRFDLCETVGQVLISFEQRVNRKSIRMEVQFPDRSIWVKADPDSITQVLYNLTDNAVKFCPEGGILGITLDTEGSKARVTVRNTGDTVPPEELPLLFDRFHKTDKSRSADKEGVGLGLYIVKTIVDAHGEKIRAESENGVTTFTFTLPLAR